ncbi:MFS transporter [Romeria aff. gracilis LEGE 07310]|uniref:MFS transporter n=1 Tax=Vasconcelosia minhoensis LEGE 07310 TaxID=915328 RepID=A0A8J7AJY9_9CYAN|nr:MFS transporter [Romeria gracilis]MBE9078988.1 MFS transporter [Romeria aff. gracilis LEGE 07310]
MFFLNRLSQIAPPPLKHFFQPGYPFKPDRLPFFYGWVILAASTFGILASIPGQTIGVSVFTDHLLTVTGLTRLELSNAYLVGTITSGCLLPLGGALLDRLGARLMIVMAAVWLGLTLAYLSVSDRIAQALSALLSLESSSLIALALLVLGFVSLRFSGQGMLTMTSRTTLGKWFDRRRGFAAGLEGIFVSFGFAIAPLVFSRWIGVLGWRWTWLSLAGVIGFGVSLVGWLLFRDNPEECGLRMDGEEPEPVLESSSTISGAAARPFIQGVTRREALRTLAFWAITLALATQALTITGITFHIVDIGADAGLVEARTVAIFVPIAVVSTAVGYGIGVASDRFQLKPLFGVMMVFEAVGVAAMAHLQVPSLRWLAVLGLGVSGGCFATLTSVALPRYFGRAHLGAIAGVQMMSLVIASALGPTILAWFKQVFGAYTLGLYACSLLPVVALGLVVGMGRPVGE